MTGFGGLQRGQDFHTQLQPATGNRTILLMKHRADKRQSNFLVQAIAVADRAKAAKTGPKTAAQPPTPIPRQTLALHRRATCVTPQTGHRP
ncbi:MAG: hypothetical protein M0Z99_00090, partial [Betaproteobacteria bacterium]|nr:hypothetical protein [Betaproteobacteria bacterium]